MFYIESEEQIDVSRFIVRRDEIAFDLVTEWDLGDHWRFSGIAKQVSKDFFVAGAVSGFGLVGTKVVDESQPIRFEFSVLRQSNVSIRIKGRWFNDEQVNGFKGTLNKFVPPRLLKTQ